MNKYSVFTFFIVVYFASLGALAKDFGKGADMAKLKPISLLLSNAEKYVSESSTIKGTVVGVCKKRGCWMELAAEEKFQSLKIKVPDGQMIFPMSAMGKTAFATGNLTAINLDLEQSKRYLATQAQKNNTEFDANSITDVVTIYQFTPVGVSIID